MNRNRAIAQQVGQRERRLARVLSSKSLAAARVTLDVGCFKTINRNRTTIMTLNPIVLLEKLINEHGSAVIIEKQLALSRDEFAANDRKLTDALVLIAQKDVFLGEKDALLAVNAIRITQLELDNQNLRSHVQQKQQQIEVLTKQIQDARNATTQTQDRDALQNKILVLLSDGKEHPEKSIAIALGITEQLAVHHLWKLLEDELASSSSYGYGKNHWQLKPSGRSYLAERQLL